MAFNSISKKFLLKIILDHISLLVIGLLVLFLYLFVQPFRRGFFCNDMSIRYPYKDNTINDYSLAALVLIPVLIGITSVEIYRYKHKIYSQKTNKTISRELYDKFIPFIFGLLASLLCTFVAKVGTGRLRPYFITICKPSVTCDDTNYYHYIEDFECLGEQDSPQGALDEMRMSFMSGHSSLMAYSMVYLVIYLQRRWPATDNYRLVRAMVQALAVNLAFFVGYTRISDYWHHWSDVLIGLIQGSMAAIITAQYMSDLKTKNNNSLFESLLKRDNNNPENGENKNRTDFQIRLLKQSSI